MRKNFPVVAFLLRSTPLNNLTRTELSDGISGCLGLADLRIDPFSRRNVCNQQLCWITRQPEPFNNLPAFRGCFKADFEIIGHRLTGKVMEIQGRHHLAIDFPGETGDAYFINR